MESVTSASNYPKVNAFSLMCSGIPSFIWVEDDKQYALWACLAQLGTYFNGYFFILANIYR